MLRMEDTLKVRARGVPKEFRGALDRWRIGDFKFEVLCAVQQHHRRQTRRGVLDFLGLGLHGLLFFSLVDSIESVPSFDFTSISRSSTPSPLTRPSPFHDTIQWARVRRCSHCGLVDTLPQHPAMHAFFRRPLCRTCIQHDDYRMITAKTAHAKYFLNDTDLLSLDTISKENPHHPNAHPIRLYSRVQVTAASTAKLARLRLTPEQRMQQQRVKSQRMHASHLLRKRERRMQLRTALHRLDLPWHGPCKMVKSFINGGTRWSRYGRRPWNLDEVIYHFQYHPCNESFHVE